MSTVVKICIVVDWVMTSYSIKQVVSLGNSSILIGPLTAVTEAFLFFPSPYRRITGYYLKFGHHFFLLLSFQLIFTNTVIGWYTVCASDSVIKLYIRHSVVW